MAEINRNTSCKENKRDFNWKMQKFTQIMKGPGY